jgi:signal peptidase
MVSAAALLVGLGVGPRTGRYRTLTMLSGSMVPTYPVGSVLIDVPERPSDLRVGQVITFQVPTGDHRVESHRVFKVVSGGAYPVIQTKGDANPAPDPWTVQVQDTTVWRVRAVVPGLGRVIVGLRHPAVRKVLVLGIPALLAVLALTEIWRTPGVPARARHQGEAPARA